MHRISNVFESKQLCGLLVDVYILITLFTYIFVYYPDFFKFVSGSTSMQFKHVTNLQLESRLRDA